MNRNSAANVQPKSAGLRLVEPVEGSHPCHTAPKQKRPERGVCLERVKGIEPSYAAWEAAVLPLNYTRFGVDDSNGFLSSVGIVRSDRSTLENRLVCPTR
jgi:hypothetical protein